ncbi:MAG: hypothetical protein AAGE65_05995 [Planctomycetota bacterium]
MARDPKPEEVAVVSAAIAAWLARQGVDPKRWQVRDVTRPADRGTVGAGDE